MYDIFLSQDAQKLMRNKSIVFLGDSNIRALYKDFLCLLQNSQFIPDVKLKKKMENSVFGDKLVSNGVRTNGRKYREEREAFISDGTCASFFFLTRVYDDYMENVLRRITRRSKPDVIIINSCVWDITRWGCDGVHAFKENLRFLMARLSRLLPDCLIIWITTPPLAAEVKGGFLVKELQFLKYSLRFHVVEANHFARKVVVDHGFDVLDSHFHLQMQIHRRSRDGIHWEFEAVRYVTNLILRHISLSWNVPLPHRYESSIVDENLVASEDTENRRVIKLITKRNAVDVKQDYSKELDVFEHNKKLRSVATVVNKNEDTSKKRNSIQLYRVPRKEESIHKHMAKEETKARHKRIRQWKQPLLGDSPQSCAPRSGHKSHVKSKTRDRHEKRSSHEPNLSNKSLQPHQQSLNLVNPSTEIHNCLKTPLNKPLHSKVPVITNVSEIPLPPYSPKYPQSQNSQIRSDESRLPSVSSSNDFPLINNPSQMPLPAHSPIHFPGEDSLVRKVEYQPQQNDTGSHFDFPVISSPSQIPCLSYGGYNNVPTQRRVVDCQMTRWTSSNSSKRGKKAAHSQSAFLNQQFPQRKRTFGAVKNSVKHYIFPHVNPGQILQPTFDFLNDEIPPNGLF